MNFELTILSYLGMDLVFLFLYPNYKKKMYITIVGMEKLARPAFGSYKGEVSCRPPAHHILVRIRKIVDGT